MHITVTHSGLAATGRPAPDFPLVRFDTGRLVCQEALVHGRYLLAGFSALGRPLSRDQIWAATRPADGPVPWSARAAWETAFGLQVDGCLLADRWEWVAADEQPAPVADCRDHVITLRHGVRPLEVHLHTRLDDTPFLVRWLTVVNRGPAPALVAAAWTWSGRLWSLPRPPWPCAQPFTLGRFRHGLWAREGEFAEEPLPPGQFTLDAAYGRSGWSVPLALLRNAVTGEAVLLDLAWSGNWAMDFLYEDDAAGTRTPAVYARVGLSGPAPLRVLAPGEAAELPAVHFGCGFGDLDALVQARHRHLRRSVTPPLPANVVHPVSCNHTGYTMNAQITEDCLLREVDVAAAIGVELLIIDAGWFGTAEGAWYTQVGDWEECPLLPHGLAGAFARIRERRMKCGLWVEAERMVRTSRIAQAHPEWFMRRRGLVIEQLDLTQPAVQTHVADTVSRLVERYQLDCFRLDYNISPHEGGELEHRDAAGQVSVVENTMWRYFEGLWRVFDQVRARFPHLLLENCSGGGGRTDLGLMSRFHWTQVTDNWDPQATLKIINGMTIALPPEQVMTLLGAISPGVADLDFMLRIGLFGHFCVSGIYPSPTEIHDESLPRWQHALRLYRNFVRPFLHDSLIFHHTPFLSHTAPGDWCVLELAAPDASQALIGCWRLPGPGEDCRHVHPRGLDPGQRYRVRYDNSSNEQCLAGGELIDRGLTIRLAAPGTSELLLFTALTPGA